LPDRDTLQRLAQIVAEFHRKISAAHRSSPYGTPELVLYPMVENFAQIRDLGLTSLQLPRLDPLEAWTRAQAEQWQDLLWQRKREGHIRECHGDMHLGNIASYEGKLEIFDGIEFNANLSWIDTINDLAFLLMDLQHRGLTREAAAFLNRYLELTGDYAGLPLLRFYQAYRAMVRAKVAAIRLAQSGLQAHEQQQLKEEYAGYLRRAEGYSAGQSPALLITHGLSGSGKSLFSGWLAEHLPGIRLRSDVERKRLFAKGDQSKGWEQGIYSKQASAATYAQLQDLAAQLLRAGYLVIVDATFLEEAQRAPFYRLANEMAVDYLILDCQASYVLLQERITQRARKGGDPSEADLAVLDHQVKKQEALTEREVAHRIIIDTRQFPPEDLLERVQQRLAAG
jgi:predicted kinase